jgi:chitinase
LTALDGRTYTQGGADFHVAMAEMLLQGFPVSQDTGAMFMGLKPEQIVIGLPAFTRTTPAEIQKALNYLTTGASFGGEYELQEPYGYPGFRGIMTWSINWDAANCHDFSSNTRLLLDELP